MERLDELLHLVMESSSVVATLPLLEREVALAGLWAAHEEAALRQGLQAAAAGGLADVLDKGIRIALSLR